MAQVPQSAAAEETRQQRQKRTRAAGPIPESAARSVPRKAYYFEVFDHCLVTALPTPAYFGALAPLARRDPGLGGAVCAVCRLLSPDGKLQPAVQRGIPNSYAPMSGAEPNAGSLKAGTTIPARVYAGTTMPLSRAGESGRSEKSCRSASTKCASSRDPSGLVPPKTRLLSPTSASSKLPLIGL